MNITQALLEKKLSIFRKELDDLLFTEPVDSEEVLRLSVKVDQLIVEYYNIKDAVDAS